MTKEKLNQAVEIAKEFIRRAKLVPFDDSGRYVTSFKHSAATKRTSLDLTRALAEMRRP